MDTDDLVRWLRAIRRLRRGSLDQSRAPADLRLFLGNGLGPVCDAFASWVDETVTDRRAADATIRFFGLERLPEDLNEIGSTLRTRTPESDLIGDRLGLSSRQTEKLIAVALTDLARDPAGPGITQAVDVVPPLSDPFETGSTATPRRIMSQVVLWAWAQIPHGDRRTAAAMMFYEYEHGLRPDAPLPPSRTERLRWRRLAWSTVQVAHYRFDGVRSRGGVTRMFRSAAPYRSATVNVIEMAGATREGVDALTTLCVEPGRAQPDALEASVAVARESVRSGREEAPEILELLRDSVQRRTRRLGPAAVPAHVEAKILALSAIVAREHRDISGVPAGEAALPRLERLLGLCTVRHPPGMRGEIVSDYLRTLQELAELYGHLGAYSAARHTLHRLRTELDRLGDPERETQPDGWLQQALFTTSVIDRHLAMARQDPRAQHAAAISADRSVELALSQAVDLPAAWALAAGTQRLSLTVDDLSREDDLGREEGHHSARAHRLRFDVHRQLIELDVQRRSVADTGERSTRSALLGIRLVAWRIALLRHDSHQAAQTQANVVHQLGRWTLATDLETVVTYQRAGMRLGIPADSTKVTSLLSRTPDRGHLR